MFFEQRETKKMGLELFHKVPAGAIETLFAEQKQPLFKRADLRKYLGIENINKISSTFHHITLVPDWIKREEV